MFRAVHVLTVVGAVVGLVPGFRGLEGFVECTSTHSGGSRKAGVLA
jgi:hypothetical protein